jgi:serine protease Do
VFAAVAASMFAAVLGAQTQDFGRAYSFAARPPRTCVENVIEHLLPSIVKIHGASGFSTISAAASGVLVSKHGHVVTIDQVMLEKDRTRVVLYDGSVHPAELLRADARTGVRVLKIDPKMVAGELRPVWPPAGDEPLFRTGQMVVSLGNCFRLAEFSEKVSATWGVVVGRANTALRYRLADVKYEGDLILTDACNNPGHYGGGLFTLDGRWIGLNTRLLDSKETNTMISAAIPSRDLLPYLEEHVLGVQRTEAETTANPPVATGIVLFEPAGRQSPPAYVDRVVAGSPAAAIGLQPDDLIVRIDDWSIRTCKELREVLAKYRPGQTVNLTYKRGVSIKQAALALEAEKR